ncbi:MAG: PIN domain-containing protein [Beijerinckiaceae bacterium]|nr:PIN domain-containing protein [Beijerinckiaceae bacterium]
MKPFLDTNILVYAQQDDPRGDRARALVLAGGTISVQVLNEFANVLRKKLGRGWMEIAEALDDVRAALDPAWPLTIETHSAAVALAGEYGFSFFDALIVAAAVEAGCDTLLTEDLQAGRKIGGLRLVNPFA